MGLVNIHTVQAIPQRWPRREKLSPTMTHVGQLDYLFIPLTMIPVFRNEGKDIRGCFVDERECVFHAPD